MARSTRSSANGQPVKVESQQQQPESLDTGVQKLQGAKRKRSLQEDTAKGSKAAKVTKEPLVPVKSTSDAVVAKPSPRNKKTTKRPPAAPEADDLKLGTGEDELQGAPPAKRPRRKAGKDRDVLVKGESGDDAEQAITPSSAKKRRRTVKAGTDVDATEEEPAPALASSASKRAKGKAKPDKNTADGNLAPSPPKVKRPRKTKEEKDAEAMPLAARTFGHELFVGAHVSAAGGVHNSIDKAIHIGANAFALFLKSQRKWDNPSLKDEHRDSFKELCLKHEYKSLEHVVPHGSYLVNLAQKDEIKAAQAYNSFLEDLGRCEKLGIKLYNFHPGSTGGEPRPSAIARIADRLNAAHRATSTVVTLLENMAADPSGNTIGGSFDDLRDIIALVEDKSRVGVCFDTCHAFAAGYDLRSPEAFKQTFDQFDSVIGAKYLRAVHMNDSKAPFASHRDLHYNIGFGFLGLRAFHNLVNEPRFHGIPLVLETPCDRKDAEGKTVEDKGIWAREIKLLESLVGMDAAGEEFKEMERTLWRTGTLERERLQEVHDRKTKEKGTKAAKAKKKKGQEEESAGESSDDKSS